MDEDRARARAEKRAKLISARHAPPAAVVVAPKAITSRRRSTHKSARILIVGAGPAGLSAAYRLARDGYEDVRIVDARDRIGGRVHTMDIRELVQKKIDHLQRARRQQAEECTDGQHPSDPVVPGDDEQLGRLRRLLRCRRLGVVDEGAAFVHGFRKENPVFQHFAPSAVLRKSEFHDQWWMDGRRVHSAVVARARRIYAYIDDRVLEELMTRPAGAPDCSVAECFDAALEGLWERKRDKWKREDCGEPQTEEEEEEDAFYKRRVPEELRLLDDSVEDDEKGATTSAAAPPLQQRFEDLAVLQDILRGLRVSQHCYVAPGDRLSSLDLLQCANDPPLVDPEVIPLRGYGALIAEVWRKTSALGGVAHPSLGVTVLKLEEKGATPCGEPSCDGGEEEPSSSYVEATVLLKDGTTDTLVADYCIVTVPVGVLKAGQLTFSPPLSSVHPEGRAYVSRQDCVDQLAMGCENKVILCWAQPWWPSDDAVQYFRSASHPYVKVIKLAALTTSAHTLVVHFAPPQSSAIERMSDAAAADEAMSVLRAMFGADSVPPCDFAHVTRWGLDACSLGSYSYVPVGSSSAYSVWLSEPSYDSRLLFAGEHCAGRDMQTVHGAYRCGEEAAANVKRLVERHGTREVDCRNERRKREAERAAQRRQSVPQPQPQPEAPKPKPEEQRVEREDEPPRPLTGRAGTEAGAVGDVRESRPLAAAPPVPPSAPSEASSPPCVSTEPEEEGVVRSGDDAASSLPGDVLEEAHSWEKRAPSAGPSCLGPPRSRSMSPSSPVRLCHREFSPQSPRIPGASSLFPRLTPIVFAPPSSEVSLRSAWLVDLDKQMDEAEDAGVTVRASRSTKRHSRTRSR